MEPKDYISAAAIVISVLSLIVSMRGASFTRRAKSAEIRVAVLTKISDVLITNSRIHRLQMEFMQFAVGSGDEELSKLVSGLKGEELVRDIDDIYRHYSEMPVSSALSAYEATFHKMHRISNTAEEIETRLQALHAQYRGHMESA
jgi:hypothetical protein